MNYIFFIFTCAITALALPLQAEQYDKKAATHETEKQSTQKKDKKQKNKKQAHNKQIKPSERFKLSA